MMGPVIDIAGDIIDEVAYEIIDKVACNVNARLAKSLRPPVSAIRGPKDQLHPSSSLRSG